MTCKNAQIKNLENPSINSNENFFKYNKQVTSKSIDSFENLEFGEMNQSKTSFNSPTEDRDPNSHL